MHQSLKNQMSIAQGKIILELIQWIRCDNHYVIPAKTPESRGKLVIEFEQEKGHEHKMFKDEREHDQGKSLM